MDMNTSICSICTHYAVYVRQQTSTRAHNRCNAVSTSRVGENIGIYTSNLPFYQLNAIKTPMSYTVLAKPPEFRWGAIAMVPGRIAMKCIVKTVLKTVERRRSRSKKYIMMKHLHV